MSTFRYRAVDRSGQPHSGEMTAGGYEAVVAALRQQGLTVVDVQEAGAPAAEPAPVAAPPESPKPAAPRPAAAHAPAPVAPPPRSAGIPGFNGMSAGELTVVTRQLATTLHAGLPILRVIQVLSRESSNAGVRGLFDDLAHDIQTGNRFSDALARHPGVFDSTYVSMVRVGELSGNLPDCMTRLAQLREKAQSSRRKIMAALVYPIFILLFSLAMTYALLAFLMPMFAPMLQQAGLNLQKDYPLTWFLLNASAFVTSWYFWGALIVFAGLPILLYTMRESLPGVAWALDWLKVKPPFVSALARKVVAARFSRSLSLLVKAGVPMLQALDLMASGRENRVVAAGLRNVEGSLQRGGTLSQALRESHLFPEMLVQMVAMGEEAGSVPEMLEKVADYYEEEVDAATAALGTLLEPAMMLLIGTVVAVFVMGVLLPILGISGGFQKQM